MYAYARSASVLAVLRRRLDKYCVIVGLHGMPIAKIGVRRRAVALKNLLQPCSTSELLIKPYS